MPAPTWWPSIRLDTQGLRRLLGSLEADVMQVLWERGEAGAPEVMAALDGRVALNTVVTVLNRLTAKGLLRRSGARRSYRHRPLCTQEEFVASVTRELVRGMVQDFGSAAAVAFTEATRDLTSDAARDTGQKHDQA